MSTDTINKINPAPYIQHKSANPQAKQDLTASNRDNVPNSHAASVDQVEVKQSTALKNLDTVRAIEQMHSRLNDLVKAVRETNEGLAQSADMFLQMQSKLKEITKNFPPFPVDSQERQDTLMNYISIKKQLEQMAVPPPPPPIYENTKHLWNDLFTEQSQIRPELLPQLGTSSSDSSVKAAETDIASVSDKISSLSSTITSSLLQR